MVVIKTNLPVKRVFLKNVEPLGDEGAGEFSEMEFAAVEEDSEPDPLQNEKVQQYLEERLTEERARLELVQKKKAEESYERGRTEGAAAAEIKITERASQLASVIASLKEARQMLLAESEDAVVQLSLAIARRFIDTAAALNSDLIKQTIKSAVKMVTEKEKVVIRINPEDLEEVREHLDDIIFIGDGIGKLEIRPDKKVDRGGCVVETEAGNIDARIESRFAEIEKALRQSLSNGTTETEDDPAGTEK